MKSILSRIIVISFLLIFLMPNLTSAETTTEAAEWYEKAYALGESSHFAEAITAYGKAIELNPQYTEAYINRGAAYDELGQYKQALSDYNKAIELNPQLAEAYNNRGDTYDELGDYKQALNDYNKAIELNPQYAKAYNNRGATYVKLGNLEQALKDFGKAVEINPEYAWAYHNRGTTYGKLKNYEQAVNDFNKAIALNPQLAASYFLRGVIDGTRGNTAPADEDIKTAARLGHQDARVFLTKRGVDWRDGSPQMASLARPAPVQQAEPSVPIADVHAIAGIDKADKGETLVDRPKDQPQPDASAEVAALINKWAQSWMSGDMNNFRSCHAANFTSKNMNLNDWVAHKIKVRKRSKNINVRIDDLRITADPTSATAVFTQNYSSSILQDRTAKKLELEKINGAWKILRIGDWRGGSLEIAGVASPAPVQQVEPAAPVADVPKAALSNKTDQSEARVDRPEDQTLADASPEVDALMNKWVQSWVSGDMKVFRSCYAESFTSKNMNLNDWVAHKIKVRKRSKNINVRIDDLRITADPTRATVAFTQYYSSSILQDKTSKKLELKKIDGEWKILREMF